MNSNSTRSALALAAGLLICNPLVVAQEGESTWADTLKNLGKVYSDKDSAFVQEVKVFGRVHYQWNYSDGDSDGDDLSGNGDELRRLRAGASVKFFNDFKALGRLNLEKGGYRDHSLGYDSFDELFVEYGKEGLFGFDEASIGYGRYKLLVGGEEHQSSKRIKTIERSAINNRFGSARPTGFSFTGEKGDVTYIAGVYSTESDPETLAGWDDGVAFHGSVEFPAFEGSITADFVYADDSDNDGSIFDYDWVTSLSYNRSYDKAHLLANLTYSDDGSENVYGFVVVPSYFLIEDKLEAAFRYQWAGTSGNTGVPRSSSSRGLRRVAANDGVGTGSGDEYQALYAGLNLYLADDLTKLMFGIEYEDISGVAGRELNGITYWAAFRAYF